MPVLTVLWWLIVGVFLFLELVLPWFSGPRRPGR